MIQDFLSICLVRKPQYSIGIALESKFQILVQNGNSMDSERFLIVIPTVGNSMSQSPVFSIVICYEACLLSGF